MKLKPFLATAAAATALTISPAFAALPVGAAAPDVVTNAVIGGVKFGFSLKRALKNGPVVLYFYPKAFTSGCTVEAHNFAEATEDFNKAGATVIGMSADDIATLTRFSVEECRNKFAVGVASSATIKAYDAQIPGKAMASRTSYVIGKDGKIAYSFASPGAQGHVENTLAAVRAIKAKR